MHTQLAWTTSQLILLASFRGSTRHQNEFSMLIMVPEKSCQQNSNRTWLFSNLFKVKQIIVICRFGLFQTDFCLIIFFCDLLWPVVSFYSNELASIGITGSDMQWIIFLLFGILLWWLTGLIFQIVVVVQREREIYILLSDWLQIIDIKFKVWEFPFFSHFISFPTVT